MTGRQGQKRQQLLDDLKETRGYWKLQDEALDRSLQNSLWHRLWNCHKADNRMNGNVNIDQIPIHSTVHRIVVKAYWRKQKQRNRMQHRLTRKHIASTNCWACLLYRKTKIPIHLYKKCAAAGNGKSHTFHFGWHTRPPSHGRGGGGRALLALNVTLSTVRSLYLRI